MYKVYYLKCLPITLDEDKTSICEDAAASPEIYIQVT